MKNIQEAVDLIFGKGVTSTEYLIEEFEEIYRTFAYNHIIAEEAGGSRMGCHEACDALYNLTALIDGLKGKNLQA